MKNNPYSILIFVSSFLLFSVQPMMSKFILPWFGGSASVWIAALLFFQTVLLLGYIYSFLISKLNVKWQVIAYLLPLILAAITLPITPDRVTLFGISSDPNIYILLILLSSIGLSFFILSSTSSLFQLWASRERGQPAYYLYAWSNAGSLLGLFSYPLIIEPIFSIKMQSYIWSVLFALFTAGVILLAITKRKKHLEITKEIHHEKQSISFKRKTAWLALPFTTVVLLMATTNYITQDIAAIPLLWVLPLGIYLLSFIATFNDKFTYDRKFLAWPLIVLTLMGVFMIIWGLDMPLMLVLSVSLLLFLIYAIICHAELYNTRPATKDLTKFYLFLSLGGALGGLFVAVIAPIIFSLYIEYNLIIGSTFVGILIYWFKNKLWQPFGKKALINASIIFFTIIVVSAGLIWNIITNIYGPSYLSRDFFGVIRVYHSENYDSLYHGRILHGAQYNDDGIRCQPTTYYHRDSTFGKSVEALRQDRELRVGVVGLGAGTGVVYGDYVRFYEINPEVVRVAEEQFSFLSDCSNKYDVVVGDARLSLEQEDPQGFDILMLDAFSGDSIPVHLLTKEAIDLYLKHLNEGGVIAIHISNKYINLRPVIAGIIKQNELEGMVVDDNYGGDSLAIAGSWAVLSRDKSTIDSIAKTACTSDCIREFSREVYWTDDYSNVVSVLRASDYFIRFVKSIF